MNDAIVANDIGRILGSIRVIVFLANKGIVRQDFAEFDTA
jgi:hypothetical protein